jgi:hypothetical protein
LIENLNQSQQLAYELLKNEINMYWNRSLISTISMSYLIEFLRQLIEYSLIANNFSRTLIVCLESLPCKLIENKYDFVIISLIEWIFNLDLRLIGRHLNYVLTLNGNLMNKYFEIVH